MSDFLWLPVLASEHGGKIDQIIIIVHVLMFVLFIGWAVFLAYTFFRFRQARNPKANYHGVTNHRSTYIEVAVIVCEALLLVGLSIPFWATKIDALPAPDTNPLEVRVVAQQFAWNIHYPGPDGIFGRSSVTLVDETTNPIGLDREDPNAKDDITTINQLYLPVNRPVILHLSSKDVIHCLGLPEFRVKQDIIPGMSIPTSFVPTMTTEEFRDVLREKAEAKYSGDGDEAELEERLEMILTRDFEIACAQLCGLGHYRMRGYVMVLTEEEFDAEMAKRAKELEAEEEFDDFFL